MNNLRVKLFNLKMNRLLDRYRDTRDETIFAEFWDRVQPVVYSFFLKRKFRIDEIEEALQLSGIDLFQHIDKWDKSRGNAVVMFLTYVRHRLYAARRKQKRQNQKTTVKNFSDFPDYAGRSNDIADVLNRVAASLPQDGELLDVNERRMIRDEVVTLRPIHREVAHLILYDSLRPRDISRRLGITRQAVSQRLQRMRKPFSELPPVQRIYNLPLNQA